jgi:flagellar biosynthesis protein FliQ
MTGRIFQALPTQTDTTVAFIYKMVVIVVHVIKVND